MLDEDGNLLRFGKCLPTTATKSFCSFSVQREPGLLGYEAEYQNGFTPDDWIAKEDEILELIQSWRD